MTKDTVPVSPVDRSSAPPVLTRQTASELGTGSDDSKAAQNGPTAPIRAQPASRKKSASSKGSPAESP